MKRRTFIQTTAAGASALTLTGIGACTIKSTTNNSTNPEEFELKEISINGLQRLMKAGNLTALEICKSYLDRIKQIDPLLNSVIEINPDALDIAAKMDQERQAGKIRGPLHGIPVLIKDNIDTGDKMATSAGSLAMQNNMAEQDAFIVQKLRKAGAILLGKTNLSEWANFRSTNSSSGWSGRGGQVRNPYFLDRSPCGSSSGTGAAISANLATVGIGTETNGSIVCPSGNNGLVGIKPTLGLWSRRGIIPIAHSQDTAGPMTRTVRDAAILLGALTGFDSNDANTGIPPGTTYTDYTPFLKTNGLKGKKIGIATQMLSSNPEVKHLLEQAMDKMKNQGAELVGVEFEHNRKWGKPSYEVLLYEFKADLNKYLKSHPQSGIRSLEDLIAYNNEHAESEMPWFGQEIFEKAQEKGDLNSPEYLEALEKSKRYAGKEGIDKVMEEHNLDAIIAQTNDPSWMIDWVHGDHFSGGSSSPAAISGYPNITVPMGFVKELPIGLSFFGKAWTESKLLEIAYAYEQCTKHRKSPELLPSIKAKVKESEQ